MPGHSTRDRTQDTLRPRLLSCFSAQAAARTALTLGAFGLSALASTGCAPTTPDDRVADRALQGAALPASASAPATVTAAWARRSEPAVLPTSLSSTPAAATAAGRSPAMEGSSLVNRAPRPTRCSLHPSGMQGAARLQGQTASWLGSASGDRVNAVEIAADCTVLAAGRLGALAGATAPQPLVAGVPSSTGLLVELAHEGRFVRRQRSFGSTINDLATNAGDELAIAGDAGLVRLDARLHAVRWSKTGLGAAARVALGDDGTVAALFGKTLRIYDANGTELASRSFGDSEVNDVAVDARGVYVTGFAQRDGGPCSQLQVAWVRAYTRTGTERWKAWDWTHAQAAATSSSCADTRGLRIATGRDGLVYFAGESAGGNTIFRYQSRDLAANAPNQSTDAFDSAYNTASNHITYVARLDTADGRVLAGKLLLSRLSTGKGNTIRPRAIAADETGRVYVAGVSACCIAQRDALYHNDRAVAGYAGGDPFVLALAPDLRSRQLWFSAADGGKGEALGVAASRGLVALGSRADLGPMLVDRAVQPAPATGANDGGHVLSWSVAAP